MISRARRILFAFLIIAVVTMSAILIRLRERAQDRLHYVQNSAPLIESTESAPQTVTLIIPNDLDGSLQEVQRRQPLPADDSTKARVLLETLLEAFRDPHSTHPIGAVTDADSEATASVPGVDAGIDDVFLMPVPQSSSPAKPGSTNSGMLAVVDFSAAFAASHPSGIEPETLTLLAILGTLHANIPDITQARFLIDGHPAETLAGHADLTRTYLTSDSTAGTQEP
jgi:Sporulation and spore germination